MLCKRLHPNENIDSYDSHCKNEPPNTIYHQCKDLITNEEADTIYKKLSKQALHNKNTKKPWGEDETKLLFWTVNKFCNQSNITSDTLSSTDWEKISMIIPGRNVTQCHYKWSTGVKHLSNKTPWSIEEDSALSDIINIRGIISWSAIAKELNSVVKAIRSGKQCRERWLNHLSPNISK